MEPLIKDVPNYIIDLHSLCAAYFKLDLPYLSKYSAAMHLDSTRSGTTLVMLLSMSKVDKGSLTHTQKRWQTPDDVVQQTLEALHYLHSQGRACRQVVLLYTNSLYHHSERTVSASAETEHDWSIPIPASTSHMNNHNKMSNHQKSVTSLLQEHNIKPVIMAWDQIVQAQDNVRQTRDVIVRLYQTDENFRRPVQLDNTMRHGHLEPIPPKVKGLKQPLGSLPTTADRFVLEEATALAGLATRCAVPPEFDPHSDIALCYPGPPLQSLGSLLRSIYTTRKPLAVFNNKPKAVVKGPTAFTWLDTSSPITTEVVLPFQIREKAKPLHSDTRKKQDKYHRVGQFATAALLIAAPILKMITTALEDKRLTERVTIAQSDYKRQIDYTSVSGYTTSIAYNREGNHWQAAEVAYNNKVTRPMLFQDDIWSIRKVEEACNRVTQQTYFDYQDEKYRVEGKSTDVAKPGTFQRRIIE